MLFHRSLYPYHVQIDGFLLIFYRYHPLLKRIFWLLILKNNGHFLFSVPEQVKVAESSKAEPPQITDTNADKSAPPPSSNLSSQAPVVTSSQQSQQHQEQNSEDTPDLSAAPANVTMNVAANNSSNNNRKPSKSPSPMSQSDKGTFL